MQQADCERDGSEAEEYEYDEGGEGHEMSHAFDCIRLAIIEVDGGCDQGDGDHGCLDPGHGRDEGLPAER